ncbi:MAG: hypothetical protein AB7F86_15580 [Bdellovibrionales bacterium]
MWQSILAIGVLLSFSAGAHEVPRKPDPALTPADYCQPEGSDFEEYRYQEQVAVCIRNVSRELKAKIYEQYGIPEECRSRYTVDHFIPLFMGGSNRAQNLWPEHKAIKATRQNLEQETYLELNRGEITYEEAVKRIVRAKEHPPRVVITPCR